MIGARRAAVAIVLAGCSFQIDLTPDAPETPDAPIDSVVPDEMVPPDPCTPIQISASSAHNCARMSNGDVWCWGKNDQGEVGLPAERTDCEVIYDCNPTPAKIAVTGATGMGMGDQHACIIAGANTYCMGANDSGQFGNNGTDSSVPLLIAERAGATEIVGGDAHTCSRHGNQVRCSGQNSYAECGDGTTNPRPSPVTTIASGIDAIGTGYRHACAIDDGFVYCWGENGSGQVVPNNTASPIMSPRIVPNVGMAVAVTAGVAHSCAVAQDGTVRCWGSNNEGQLGVGNNGNQQDAALASVAGIVAISAGVNHTCALASGGTVYCWGEGYTNTPTAVELPGAASSIAAGSYHDCFVLAPSSTEPKGSVWCRGWNGYGQLGRKTVGGTLAAGPVSLCP